MTVTVLTLLRALHIVAGTLWTGGVLLVALFVVPAARASGPGGAAVLKHLSGTQRLPYVLLTCALVAILSGIAVTYQVSRRPTSSPAPRD